MVKIDVISGFLGAGKTTLIKRLLASAFKGQKVVLIENEFGEIGVDGAFLKDAGIEIREINSGCICCSLVGDFEASMKEIIDRFAPDRVIIEPSGVGKLSDIVRAIEKVTAELQLNIIATVVDGGKVGMYVRNFGEFYIDQVKQANTIVVSKTDKISEDKLLKAVEQIREINPKATLITTNLEALESEKILSALENDVGMVDALLAELQTEELEDEHEHCHHHHHDDEDEHEHCHHDHDHDEKDEDEDEHEHCHHHHHEDDDDEHEHEHCHHHHDDDDEDEDEHEHCHHHHDDDDEDEDEHEHHCCHHEGEHHHHHHHGGHDADEVFASWGDETHEAYTYQRLDDILKAIAAHENVLRAKGLVKSADCAEWYYFDLVAGDYEIRKGAPDVCGRVCVIGAHLSEDELKKLFKRA